MPSGPKSTTKASSSKRNPIVAASPFARSREYIVQNEIMIDAADKGSVDHAAESMSPSAAVNRLRWYPHYIGSPVRI